MIGIPSGWEEIAAYLYAICELPEAPKDLFEETLWLADAACYVTCEHDWRIAVGEE